ncbi:MAG: ABC transporter permease [Verrucomicrobiales bacterium]|nr:ABC transporter permease [Verrucomicrobiales bacterium]MDA7644252.1 ABC transporter permease [Verrucomicrobiales bacterium]MDB2347936.1 ABC transporter permease [Verrucomicrobiales bacterium]MDF1784369.1 ABC transporter permease [Verrucomicrobiales bacterium]
MLVISRELQNLRLALRLLRKNPGFATVAVLTLAIGIGASTVVFTIVNGVILRPLDYPDSDRIVLVWEGDHEKGFSRAYHDQTSPANFMDWRRENTVFEAMGLAENHSGDATRSFIYASEKEALRLNGRFVSHEYFRVFGLQPVLGRSFMPEEETKGADRVVVISHRLWTNLFDQDADIIGKTIPLENRGRFLYEVIGVMPEGFNYPTNSDVWVSMAHMHESVYRRGGDVMAIVARLKEGVSIEEGEAEMNVIQRRLYNEYKGLELQSAELVVAPHIVLEPLLHSVVSGVRSSLSMFSGAVLLLLLIAVANVANLLLSRALTRQREMSIRAALGAQRWHLIKQLLIESGVLSLIGGVTGVILAWMGLNLLLKFNAGAIPRAADVGLDWHVLVFTLVLSLVTGVLFGFAPAVQTSRPNLNDAMRSGANRQTADRSHHFVRNGFSVFQVSLALVLLIGAGLLIQSFAKLQQVDPGIDAEQLLTVGITMTGAAYQGREQRVAFVRRLSDEMKATPGVESVSAVSVNMARKGWPYPFSRSDRPPPKPSETPRAGLRSVTQHHYKTYGIPILRGRPLNERDAWHSERVMMVNERFAETYYPDEEVLGSHIRHYGRDWRIVGVFGNHKNAGLTRETEPEVNMPYAQWEGPDARSVYLTVRTEADPLALAPVVTRKVRALNPDQPLNQFLTMQAYLDGSTSIDRFRSLLVGMFAIAALLLASIGIYGVISYSAAQRTPEMGIRLALGAQRSDLLALILKQGFKLTLSGVALGLIGSFLLTRALESRLYGIKAHDPFTFITVSIILTTVGVAASTIPAVRAMRVSPTECLRSD